VQIGEQILLDSWRAETGTLIRKLTVSGSHLDLQLSQPPELIIEGAAGTSTLKLTSGQPVTLTYRWK
jgi:hypothetical protein